MRTSLALASLMVAVSAIGSGCDSDSPPPPLEDYFAVTPYNRADCNVVDDRLVGERPMRLFYNGSVQMLPVTQGLASYYHRHSLSFSTDAQPEKTSMSYALHNDQAALIRDLLAKYPGVNLSDEEALMAENPALYAEIITYAANFLLKPMVDFAETHSGSEGEVTNLMLITRLESDADNSIVGPDAMLAGLAISPALLAEFDRTGDEDAAIWAGVALPAGFTPMMALGNGVLSSARRADPVLDDLVTAHEFGHTGALIHSTVSGNLMYPGVAPGFDDCTDSLDDQQLTTMAAAYGLGPQAPSGLQAERVAAPTARTAPAGTATADRWAAAIRGRFPPARLRALMTGERGAMRPLVRLLFPGAAS